MKRLQFITGLAGAFALPALLQAQRPARLPKLGFLSELPEPTPEQIAAGPVVRMLADLGWVEGKSITIERRTSAGRRERLPGLAAELVSTGVDVIWTIGPRATNAAVQATKNIPIVFVRSIAALEFGCAQSLARPGGNCTGVTSSASLEVYAKPFEFLRDILPSAKRVTAVGETRSLTYTLSQPLVDMVARNTGIEVIRYPVAKAEDIDVAFSAVVDNRSDAVYLHSTELTFANRQRIADLSLRHRLPSLHDESIYVEAGGLLSYGSDIWATIKQSLRQVDRILRGAKPADMPIEQPTRFDLVLNMKTARELGLKIAPAVLLRADRVIE